MQNLCETASDLFFLPLNNDLTKFPSELLLWDVDTASYVSSLLYLSSQSGHVLLFSLEHQPSSSPSHLEIDLNYCAGTI